MSVESGFSMDEAGNVVLAISAENWKKFMKHTGRALRLDEEAHAAYNDDRFTRAASLWRDSSNWAYGHMYNMATDSPELIALLDEAKATGNGPGK